MKFLEAVFESSLWNSRFVVIAAVMAVFRPASRFSMATVAYLFAHALHYADSGMTEEAREMLHDKTVTHKHAGDGLGPRLFQAGLLALLLACSWPVCAADFSLTDIQGETHRLADYRGKWVLVNFWATWCTPCLSEIPELTSLHDAHKNKDLVVIGIAVESGSSKKVTDFARAHGISYPVVMGDREINEQIGATDVLPTSYLYNPKGEQVSYQAGELTRASVEAYIRNK